jgi:hypothetical protein
MNQDNDNVLKPCPSGHDKALFGQAIFDAMEQKK